MKSFLFLFSVLLMIRTEARITFPADVSVLNVQRDFGAKGDGKTDDTVALQQAIEASCGNDSKRREGKSNIVYLPNGIYRVTKSLVVKTALGPWFYGESRDGTIIKLDDGVKDVTALLRSHPNEKGPTSADWFMRNFRHFTIDVGNNPETDGIRYYATNSGTLADVRVIGFGKVGINAGFLDQSGPNLIQDAEIDGFETGVLAQWVWSTTLSRIKITNCRKLGVSVSANVVAIEDLTVENTPLGIMIDEPNGWEHWSGVVALTGGTFRSGDANGPAILNKGKLYARNVTATGFARAIASTGSNGQPDGLIVNEFRSGGLRTAFTESADRSLQLPIKREPDVPWENDTTKWLCADDFGMKAGDNDDDSAALERAFAAAAEQGKTVVYFRGCGGREPNWFRLAKPVRVPKPVRMVLALGWGRLLGEENGGLVIDDESSPLVKIRHIDSFGGKPIQVVNASRQNTLIIESSGVHVIGRGAGDIFMTDCPGRLKLEKPGQKAWVRQLNLEGNSDDGLAQNNGGHLWALGVKHEGRGVRFATRQGGLTEVLGLFNYGGYKDEKDVRPLFLIEDAQFSVAGLREIAFDSHTATIKVRETRANQIQELDKKKEGGWIGWSLFSAQPKN